MIVDICRVLVCLALGDVASRFLPIPLPGSVVGLLILFVWLLRRGSVPAKLTVVADRTLELFGLFFVPAGVGILAHKDKIRSDYLAITAAITIGTLVTIAVTALAASLVDATRGAKRMIGLHYDWSIVHDLANRPLVAPAITILAFVIAQQLQRRWPSNPLFNPTLFAIVLVIVFVEVGDVSYVNYATNTQVINFMLGPAVVLLAVPLYNRLGLIKASWRLVACGLVVGAPVGIIGSVAIGILCHAQTQTLYSLAPRSVTTGIALGLSELLGGIPALTAVFVISTGIFGAVFGPWLLRAMGIRDDRIFGMAIGMASHGIGTARAFQVSETAGAFASLAMSLNGVVTAIMIPLLTPLVDLHPDGSGLGSGAARSSHPATILPNLTGMGRKGSELWSVLVEHQTLLLTTFAIMLVLAGAAASLLAIGNVRWAGYQRSS